MKFGYRVNEKEKPGRFNIEKAVRTLPLKRR